MTRQPPPYAALQHANAVAVQQDAATEIARQKAARERAAVLAAAAETAYNELTEHVRRMQEHGTIR